jgi:uncharacterized protein YxjI
MQDRREERQANQPVFYKMREKLVAIGDDYWIEDSNGNRVYKVNGKALRLRSTLDFEDAHGQVLAKIQERVARIRETMVIEDANGNSLASVRKAMITPFRERWTVKVENGPDISVQGNIIDHEYKLELDGTKVAEVSKKWLRVADTYGVEVAQGQNPVLILAITAVLDQMAHE